MECTNTFRLFVCDKQLWPYIFVVHTLNGSSDSPFQAKLIHLAFRIRVWGTNVVFGQYYGVQANNTMKQTMEKKNYKLFYMVSILNTKH